MRILPQLLFAAVAPLAYTQAIGNTPFRFAALAVIVNNSNPSDNLAAGELRRLFLGEIREWPNHRHVTIAHGTERDKFELLALKILQMTSAEYARFLVNLEYRGQEKFNLKVLNNSRSACKFVLNVPGALAIVLAEEMTSAECKGSVKAVRIDGNLPGDSRYKLQ